MQGVVRVTGSEAARDMVRSSLKVKMAVGLKWGTTNGAPRPSQL